MPMVANDMADLLKNGLGFGTDPTSNETKGMARAIIAEFGIAIVSNAPGTVNGAAPPSGGPLTGGTAVGGLIAGMAGATLAAKMQMEMGKPSITPQLLGFAGAMALHFLTGLVSFTLITGACTNTPVSPGALTGAGANGKIAGYSGPTLATAIAAGIGQPSASAPLISMCTNLVTYIMANATVTYAGTVVGICPAGGGPITAGAASGGTIA